MFFYCINKKVKILFILSIFLLNFSCKKKVFVEDSEVKKIKLLFAEAEKEKDTLMNEKKADSLLESALKKSLLLDNGNLISQSNIEILKNKTASKISDADAEKLFREAINNAEKNGENKLITEAYFATCDFLIRKNEPEKALNYLNLMSFADSETEWNRIRKLVVHSKINQQLNLPYEQLRNLLDAQYMAMDIENDSLKNRIISLISDFYFYEKKYENALNYAEKLKKSIESKKPVDSVEWYFAEVNRAGILSQSLKNDAVPEIAEKIDNFGKRKNIPKLRFYAQSLMRTYFIDHNEFEKLIEWYRKNPQELVELSKNNPSFYYRVQAYMAENIGNMELARKYFELSLQAQPDANVHFLYTHHLRRGDFEKRQGNDGEANHFYELAFENILKTNRYFNQITLGENIAEFYKKNGDKTKLLEVVSKVNDSKSKLIEVLNNENIRDIELTNILAQKELERKKTLEKEEEKHLRQYLIISIFIILIIMSMVVSAFYHVPVWWIKSMGYLSFLMFFEFIILLIDGWLHHITHGAPIWIILAKVVILSALFPLHHWMEKAFVNLLVKNDLRAVFKKYSQKISQKRRRHIRLKE